MHISFLLQDSSNYDLPAPVMGCRMLKASPRVITPGWNEAVPGNWKVGVLQILPSSMVSKTASRILTENGHNVCSIMQLFNFVTPSSLSTKEYIIWFNNCFLHLLLKIKKQCYQTKYWVNEITSRLCLSSNFFTS